MGLPSSPKVARDRRHSPELARVTRAPEVLIVGVGWESTAKVASSFHPPSGTKLLVLPTDEAIATYNSLKAEGVRVAIHVHSTC